MAASLESTFVAILVLLSPLFLATPLSFAWKWWTGMEPEHEHYREKVRVVLDSGISLSRYRPELDAEARKVYLDPDRQARIESDLLTSIEFMYVLKCYNITGDRVDTRKVGDITRALFATEQFDDIQIGKELNTLIITVKERPSISAIELSGNKALKTEQLLESLDGVGIKEGEVYKRSTLEKVKSELVRSYASNGRYGASVSIEEIDKPRNRIEIDIEVDEGKSAKIEKINIIGNEIFTTDEILNGFELSEGSFFSFLKNIFEFLIVRFFSIKLLFKRLIKKL